ncbi:TetR family transcriptional regulator [Spiractinospora alimapuensis]|uniref:TetR/AcrR family transcriptional regulator n=1 Tax=Spiractinospora alimapuensis TaxID=2820884 RepID=UPI001F3D9217|nr:TetR family transcriptional regulator [Spiractinospora alimapuensis]QVQ50310.1 TetR family transcriptional regulator [Spiractinospora alimapuensis]
MPPPNRARRDALADAAIDVLARDGSHGLTHRAVDDRADAPNGTTSRYFRSRAALLEAVAERLTDRLRQRIDGLDPAPTDPVTLTDSLVATIMGMLDGNRSMALALMELHLEGNRSPVVRAAVSSALSARVDLIRGRCRSAGVEVSLKDAQLLDTTITGILFTTITVHASDDPLPLVRAMVQRTLTGQLLDS